MTEFEKELVRFVSGYLDAGVSAEDYVKAFSQRLLDSIGRQSKEQPVSEGLEDVAEELAENYAYAKPDEVFSAYKEGFIEGYKAQKKQSELSCEGLEEAAKRYEHNRVYQDELDKYANYLDSLEEGETPRMEEPSPETNYLLNADMIESFKAGASWQKEKMMMELSDKIASAYQLGLADKEKQMMKEAVEGEVLDSGINYLDLSLFDAEKLGLVKDNKVKLIIIKED